MDGGDGGLWLSATTACLHVISSSALNPQIELSSSFANLPLPAAVAAAAIINNAKIAAIFVQDSILLLSLFFDLDLYSQGLD